MRAIEAASHVAGIETSEEHLRTEAEIDAAMSKIASRPHSGFIVLPDAFTAVHRKQIVDSAGVARSPGIFPFPDYASDGGLMYYGPNIKDLYRRASAYIDRILRSAKVSDLPVQLPSRYDLVINLKTAKALGLTIPETLLATADEVIQ